MTTNLFSPQFYLFVYLFFVYAFMGWILETVFATIRNKKFINRGFLFGPICPMYGLGAILIIYLYKLLPPHNTLLVFFVVATFATTLLEYITGYILKKSFNTTWWDYSQDPLNIDGIISLPYSLVWGAIAVLLIKLIHPNIHKTTYVVYTHMGIIALNILIALIMTDFIYTLISLRDLNSVFNQIQGLFYDAKLKVENFSEDTIVETVYDELKARYQNIINDIQTHNLRLTRAFPQLTLNKLDNIFEDLKQTIFNHRES